MTAVKPFLNSLQLILAELERVDMLVRLQVMRAREIQHTAADFQGLYISNEEIDFLVNQPIGLPRWVQVPMPHPPDKLRNALNRMKEEIELRKAQSAKQGLSLNLVKLIQIFELSDFDVDVLLLCLAPELDLRYERLYAYLHDDVTKKRASVDLVLKLLCSTIEENVISRKRFAHEAPLMKYEILRKFQDPSNQESPLLGQYLKVDERIVNFLLDSNEVDGRIKTFVQLTPNPVTNEEVLIASNPVERLRKIVDLKRRRGESQVLYFQGPYGVGKRAVAELLCREMNLALMYVDGKRLLSFENSDFVTAVMLLEREALLQSALVYWDAFDTLLLDGRELQLKTLINSWDLNNRLFFLAGEIPWEPTSDLAMPSFMRVEFPHPSSMERKSLWHNILTRESILEMDFDLGALASKFRFSGGQIRDATATALNLAHWRDPDNGHVTEADIYEACRLQSNRKLSELAIKINPQFTWEDIVLPPDRMKQLRELCNSVRFRTLVYDEWGFRRRLSLGKGINALFAGPSGTGKTMAAEILAGELRLDLYKIDLSTVVSKYIGETEKNLARIFHEAETSNAILFFDEADALFGKRSEVRDSHDRYANIETGYLLQKMEEHEGITILATNLRQNMDDAFIRRMAYTITFPFPEEEDRMRIWENIWPSETTRAEDIDYNFMAHNFKLAGGNIKNVALAAAFLAAADGHVIRMDHLILATKRELQKMGKVCVASDFGPYYPLIGGQ